MNKIWLNITAVLLLSGCSMFSKNPRTDSKGEPVNKNAPVFISPKTNGTPVNKPNTNQPAPNNPAKVSFNAESYVMVKEKDLNALVDQKTNDNLLNIKKSNANAKQPNKELDAAIDNYIKKLAESKQVSLTANVLQLAPVEQEKASNPPPAIHPFFAFIMIAVLMAGFILTVGYFFFIKKKVQHETPKMGSETPTTAPASTTETETKN